MHLSNMENIVSTTEVADLLSVRPNRVAVWLHRKKMPMPKKYLNNGKTPLWYSEDIINWASATGKMPIKKFR